MLVGSTVVELFCLSALSPLRSSSLLCLNPDTQVLATRACSLPSTPLWHSSYPGSPWSGGGELLGCLHFAIRCVCARLRNCVVCAKLWMCVRVWACVPDCVLSCFVFNAIVSSSEGPTDAHQRWFTSRPTLFSSKRSYFLRMETEPCSPSPSCTYTGQTVVWVVTIWCSRNILDRPALLLVS